VLLSRAGPSLRSLGGWGESKIPDCLRLGRTTGGCLAYRAVRQVLRRRGRCPASGGTR